VNLLGLRSRGGHAMVHSEEELKMLVTASQEAGVLEEAEEQMLHRVLGFADLTAGQVMVPRTELLAVEADAPADGVLAHITRSDAHRLLVYRTNLDNVVGILHMTDVVKALAAGTRDINPGALAREALAVPETLAADDLLAALRRRGVQEAVVIDEHGGTAGLVTFESLMERIVGDLGAVGAGGRITVRPDGSAEIDGLALVTDVNEQFDLGIDEDVYTTVGGYMLGRLGRRPRAGDTIEAGGRQMRVEALDGLRVAKVWLSIPKISPPSAAEERLR
jgi:CBS domain containing-hemolysin-like protein